MENIKAIANGICEYLLTIKEINNCKIYGSINENIFDEYSDIDIELDVSGYDNSIFVTKIPEIMSKKYPIIYYDYARSLMPSKFIVSMAISEKNPFLIVDIDCKAIPHMNTLKKDDNYVNNKFTHIIKLFIANYKHYIRGNKCEKDILRMYKNIYNDEVKIKDMLLMTYKWLIENAEEKYIEYLENINIKDIENKETQNCT